MVSNEGKPTNRPVLFSQPDITEADAKAVVRVLRSGWLTTGPECELLERELEAYLGVPHVVAMSSCTAALETAVAVLRLPAGARVAVPTWTFVSSALAIARQGGTPVLIDVDPDTLNVSPDALDAAISEGVDAVMAVHFGGTPVSNTIHQLCASAQLPLIEDAAHALGAIDHRGRVGGHGTVGACFSFYATKNLTCGEGGALATEDQGVASFARSYRMHGLSADSWSRQRTEDSSSYELLDPGIKANLPDILAALARSQLSRFDDMQAQRRALVRRYRAELRHHKRLQIVPSASDAGSADHLMVVILPATSSRQRIVAHMAAEGIHTSVHFRPLHRFQWFAKNAVIGPTGTGVADGLASRALSLPLHSAMSDDDVVRVSHSLLAALDQ